MDSQASIAYLAELRRNELLDEGKKPLAGSADEMRKRTASIYMEVTDSAMPKIAADFKMLRDEAKEYEKNRTAYMTERLKAGQHPDTDKTFWADWDEPEPPVLSDRKTASLIRTSSLIGGPSLAIAIVLLAIWRKRVKTRRMMG